MFWLVLVVFIILCVVLTALVLIQEPKNGGMGDALGGGGGGGGGDFGTAGGTAGGLQRLTIIIGVIWVFLALILGIIPR